jgi:hypothetical protein
MDSVSLLTCEIGNQILELLATNLNRFREADEEERAGVFGVLGIFENFIVCADLHCYFLLLVYLSLFLNPFFCIPD